MISKYCIVEGLYLIYISHTDQKLGCGIIDCLVKAEVNLRPLKRLI